MATVQDLLKKVRKSLEDSANSTVVSSQRLRRNLDSGVDNVKNSIRSATTLRSRELSGYSGEQKGFQVGDRFFRMGNAAQVDSNNGFLPRVASAARLATQNLPQSTTRTIERAWAPKRIKEPLARPAGEFFGGLAQNTTRGVANIAEGIHKKNKLQIAGGAFQVAKPFLAAKARPGELLINTALGATIGGVLDKNAGKGAAEGFGATAVTRFTNPATDSLTRMIVNPKAGLATRQVLKRVVGAGANVLEDRMINKTTGVKGNDLASAAFGAIMSGNDDALQSVAPHINRILRKVPLRKVATQAGDAKVTRNGQPSHIIRLRKNGIRYKQEIGSGGFKKAQYLDMPAAGGGKIALDGTDRPRFPKIARTGDKILRTGEVQSALGVNEAKVPYNGGNELPTQNLRAEGSARSSGFTGDIGRNLGVDAKRVGWKDIRGQFARSPEEMGTLLKDFRNPKQELLHVVYKDKDGKVLAHSALTGKGLASVNLDPKEVFFNIEDRARRLGAERISMAHNHPSGEINPSFEDIKFTEMLSNRYGDKFDGMTILDHDKVRHLGKGQEGKIFDQTLQIDLGDSYSPKGPQVTSPEDLRGLIQEHYEIKPGKIGIISTDSQGRPTGVREISASKVQNLDQTVNQFLKEQGGFRAFLVGDANSVGNIFGTPKQLSSVADIMVHQGGQLTSVRESINSPEFASLGEKLGSNIKDPTRTAFRLFEDQADYQNSFSTPKQVMDDGLPAFLTDIDAPGYPAARGYNDLRQRGYSVAQLEMMGPNAVRQALKDNTLPKDHPTYQMSRQGKNPQGFTTNNKPVKVSAGRYEQFAPSDEEVSQTVGQNLLEETEHNGLVRWFNSVFDPLKNAPRQVQDIMQNWRKDVTLARARANQTAQLFADIPEEDGWKLIQYIQNPTNRNAMELGLDADRYAPQIEKLRTFYDATRREGIAAGLDVKYLDNYLNQVWKETPGKIDAKIKAGAGRQPSWVKERSIPTYQEGMSLGLTPRFTHPAQLAAHYRQQLDRALANQKMVDQLVTSEILLPSSSAPADWKSIDSPFFPKVKVDFGNGEAVVMDYKAPPDVARAINNIFEVREPGALAIGQKLSKGVQEFALSGGIPKTPLNSFTFANMQKEAMAGRVRGPVKAMLLSFSDNSSKNYFDQNQLIIEDMASEGLRTYTNSDYTTMYKNLAENKNLRQRIFGWAGNLFNDAFNEPTFKRFMPILQVEFYKDAYDGALKSGLDQAQARAVAAETTKKFYGITDAFSRPGQTEEALSTFMMAPAFREAMINFWGNTIKSADPRTWNDPSFSANRKFIVGSAVTYALYNVANMAINGRAMHENKPGKELSLEIPIGGGRSFFMPFLFTVGTVPRRFFEAAGELREGDIAGAAQKFASFASIPVNAAITTLTNRNFYGAPISKEDDPALVKAGKQVAAGVGQMMHPWIRTGVELGTGQRTMKEAWPGMLELPLYPSASTDVAHLRAASVEKFRELNAIDPQMAMAYAEQQKVTQETNDIVKAQKEAIQRASGASETKGFWNWLGSLVGGEEKLVASDISQLDIPDKDKKSLIKQKLELEQPLTPDEYMIHYDLNKYSEKPSDPIKATRQEAERYKAALGVYREEELTDQTKSELISRLKVDEGDIAYYDIASDSTRAVRRIFTEQYISELGADKDKVEALSLLRREVRGERILTDTVLEELVDYGHLSESEGKQLKNIIWDEQKGKLVAKKGKGKKLSIKLTKLQTVSGSSSGQSVPRMKLVELGGGNLQNIQLSPPERRESPKIRLKQLSRPSVKTAQIKYQPTRERRAT